MVNIILVDKSGDLKLCKYNVDKGDELYKKCKFKKQDNFEKELHGKQKKTNMILVQFHYTHAILVRRIPKINMIFHHL